MTITDDAPSLAMSRGTEGLPRREVITINANFWMAAISLGIIRFENEQTKQMFRDDMRLIKQEMGRPCNATEHSICCWPKPCRITGD